MRELFTTKSLTIPSGHAVSGIAKEAQTVRILCGRVWITVEGVSHDYWLFAGDTFTLTPGALTVIESDGAASRLAMASAGSRSVLLSLRTQVRHLSVLAQRFARNRNAGAALSQRA
jgi:hypothetical protein